MRPILVVEDDEADIEAIREGFQRHFPSRKVVFARDGVAALKLVCGDGDGKRRKTIDPALIMLDLNVPVLNGGEMLDRLKKNPQTSYIPVVIFTDHQTDNVRSEAYGLGANAYVVKPFSRMKLIDTVCQIGKFWLEKNHLPPMRVSL